MNKLSTSPPKFPPISKIPNPHFPHFPLSQRHLRPRSARPFPHPSRRERAISVHSANKNARPPACFFVRFVFCFFIANVALKSLSRQIAPQFIQPWIHRVSPLLQRRLLLPLAAEGSIVKPRTHATAALYATEDEFSTSRRETRILFR